MNFVNDYALLIAVALPVVVILAIQAYLFVAGERGTLLVPGFNRYPEIKLSAKAETAEQRHGVVETFPSTMGVEPSNDETERLAA